MVNKFTDWFVRVFSANPPEPPVPPVMREHDKTLDDVATNAPKRRKAAARKAPEQK